MMPARDSRSTVRVRNITNGEPRQFEVVVRDRGGETCHEVTLSAATLDRLSGGKSTPDNCVRAAFLFLLDREPKESILRRFDISVIERYFPQFFDEFPCYRDKQ